MNIWNKDALLKALWTFQINYIQDEEINPNRFIISNIESLEFNEKNDCYYLTTHSPEKSGFITLTLSKYFIQESTHTLANYILILTLKKGY